MHFTATELEMLRHLRLQHDNWRTTRLIILIGSAIVVAFALWRIACAQWDTAVITLLGLGAAGFSRSIGSWKGRPEVTLLLKLAEAQAQQGAPAGPPGSEASGHR